MKDFRGKEIQVGDKIAHGVRSNQVWLEEADVLEVYEDYIVVKKINGYAKSKIKESKGITLI